MSDWLSGRRRFVAAPAAWFVAALLTALCAAGPLPALAAGSSADAELAPELEFLRPLVGPSRVGSYIDSAPGELEMTVQWEIVHGGSAVRFTKSVPDADFTAETLYYWDRLDERVRFLTLTNRGIVSSGDVREEHGSIILSGVDVWADHETDFQLTFTLLPDGTVRDVYERFEGNQFVPGHVIEYRLSPG